MTIRELLEKRKSFYKEVKASKNWDLSVIALIEGAYQELETIEKLIPKKALDKPLI